MARQRHISGPRKGYFMSDKEIYKLKVKQHHIKTEIYKRNFILTIITFVLYILSMYLRYSN